MAAPAPSDRTFYVRMGLLLLGLIALGFGGRALTAAETDAPAASILLPHIGCIGAWYLLFAAQARWARRRQLRPHRIAGYLSVPLAAALLWTGFAVTAANYRIQGDAPLVFFNVLNLAQFTGLYVAAIANVPRPRTHGRLMLYASIAMMPPALVRIVQAVALPEPMTVLLIVGLWIPGIRHDRATRGRVHGATWIGVGAIAVGVALGGPIGFSETWAELVESWIPRP